MANHIRKVYKTEAKNIKWIFTIENKLKMQWVNPKNDDKTNKKGVKHISIPNYLVYIYITILIYNCLKYITGNSQEQSVTAITSSYYQCKY